MITPEQEKLLAELRVRICDYLGKKRQRHTLAVENEMLVLSRIYLPDAEFSLRAAALLHDITKELSHEDQLRMCDEFSIGYTEEEVRMPKIFHSRTAASLIPRDFPEFADETVISAVRWHTTGRAGMTMGDKLLYLADYIEKTRTFEDCVKLRERFYSGLESAKAENKLNTLLRDVLILSFDMTVRGLVDDGDPIHPDTVCARNSLLSSCEVN